MQLAVAMAAAEAIIIVVVVVEGDDITTTIQLIKSWWINRVNYLEKRLKQRWRPHTVSYLPTTTTMWWERPRFGALIK